MICDTSVAKKKERRAHPDHDTGSLHFKSRTQRERVSPIPGKGAFPIGWNAVSEMAAR